MYKYKVSGNNPKYMWLLDDTSPFQEYSGLNLSAGLKAGSVAPTTSVPLVNGASKSMVFKANSVAQFGGSPFEKGNERKPFSLEAWVLPVLKTQGVAYGSDFLLNNPAYTGTITGWSVSAGAELTSQQMMVNGVTKTVMRSRASTDSQTYSPTININSSKAYRIRMRVYDTVDVPTSNQFYIGLNTYTAESVTTGSIPISRNSGAASSSNTNFYFWYAATPPLGRWFDMEFYVFPAGTAASDMIGHGHVDGQDLGTNAMLDPTTAKLTVRWLNWANSSTSIARDVYATDVEVVEVAKTAANTWTPVAPASTSPQQILSHDRLHDGLTIEGNRVKFSTMYATAPESACYHDLEINKLAHVVGTHTDDRNQLWVNGEMVASVDITDEQYFDSFIPTDGNLYSGFTTSSQEIAINGVAFYNRSLTAEVVSKNYLAGVETIGQSRIYTQLGGASINIDGNVSSVYYDVSYRVQSDFERGEKVDVEFTPISIEPRKIDDVAVAGSWTVAVPIAAQEHTSIYGVAVEWSGRDVNVAASLDGTTWTPLTSGKLVPNITNGYDPTGKILEIKVEFPAGNNDAYLESLSVRAFANNTIENQTTRPLTASHPAVLRRDYEPRLYRDDNGVSLNGGTLTLGVDAGELPEVVKTVEMWIKPLSGAPTISIAGTKYRNGVADSTLPVGEWSLIHIVSATDITSAMTVAGDCIVGQLTLYEDALSADDVLHIFQSYAGTTALQIVDETPIAVAEYSTPTSIYAHDWAISAAG